MSPEGLCWAEPDRSHSEDSPPVKLSVTTAVGVATGPDDSFSESK